MFKIMGLKLTFIEGEMITVRFKIFLLFVLLGCLGSGKEGKQTSAEVLNDRQALVDLYNATNGANWNNNSGWLDGNPSGSWHGVTVNSNGRVVRLDLYKNGLQGNLPASIGNLTKLTYLNVKGNQLTGNIPSEIGNMASIEWMILSGRTVDQPSFSMKQPPKDLTYPYHPGKYNSATNDFTGAIPTTIGKLKNLKRFELSGSSITSLPDEIGNCTALEGIYISWSKNLNQEIPSTIGNLTNLHQLYMESDRLIGAIPSSMSNLTKLTFVHLGNVHHDDNQLTGTLPDFSHATELRSFILDRNNISGDWPHYWNNGNFTHLNTLRATWNDFTGTLHGFDHLPQMRSFGLTGNALTGELPPSITSIGDGKCILIGLGWNDLTGDFPQNWNTHFGQLRIVYLNDNHFTGNISSSFFNAIDNPDLQSVYLQNNNFTSVDSTAMNNVSSSKLQTIDISGNDF